MTEREIFLEALELTTPEARAGYLQGACGRDATLRRKVDELLKEHFSNDSLLAGPALEGERTAVGSHVQEAPTQMLGRYKLLEKIGEGGFGEVWMAEQREPIKRRVALKIIKLGMDSRQIVNRFAAERQALAMMDHPNIAKIFDAGVTGVSNERSEVRPQRSETGALTSDLGPRTSGSGRPYFVMELVRGIKITEYCDQNQLPTQERLRLFILVCQAIQHAHQKGIIHRDIKPSNILVTLHDGVPVPKVIDFGIAKATQQELTDKTVFTQFQQFVGTPAYISPEQAEMSGLDIDTRADIYSLGVLLYELLVSQTPFDAREMMQGGLDALRQIIREREPQRPSTKLNTLLGEARATAGKRRQTEVDKLVHQLEGDLDWIVMKCLEKDRTRRYDTANGLAMDIQRHLTNEPVLARPPSNFYRFQKLVRRNTLGFVSAAVVAMALVAGLGVSTWMFFKEKQARQRAGLAEQSERQLRQQAETVSDENRRLADENQVRLIRLHTANGLRLGEEEDWGASLPFLSEALKLGEKASRDIPMARFRLRAVLDRWPRLVQVMQHTSVNRVEFSPDSSHLLLCATQNTGSETDDARIWDIATGKPVTVSIPAMFASFSPDGKRFVAIIDDQGLNASVRDAASGKQVGASIALSTGGDAKAWFAPDGNRILTIDSHYGSGQARFGEARVWDAATAKPISPPMRHADVIYHAAWSPDGQQVATVSEDETVQVWNVNTGKAAIPPLKSGSRILHAAFSPDSKYISVGGWGSDSPKRSTVSGGARIFDLQTGAPSTPLMIHAGVTSFIDFSPDGRRLVSASSDRTARVWDVSTGAWVTPPLRHSAEVVVVRFSPDGSMIVSTSYDGTARLWDAETGEPLAVLKHMGKVQDAAFSPDGRFLATASEDHLVRIWDLSSTERLPIELFDEGAVGSPASFSPDGSRVAAPALDSVNVWDVGSGELLLKLEEPDPDRRISYVAALFSPNGRQLLTCGGVYDARTGERIAGLPIDNVMSAQFSATGKKIVVSSFYRSATFVLEAATGKVISQLPDTSRESLHHVAFSPDERLVATAGHEGNVRVWDAASGLLARTLHHDKGVLFVSFSPDSSKVATAGWNNTIRVWGISDGRAALPPMQHKDQTMCVAFSPDGRLIASASWDMTARIWDAASGRPMTPPLQHPGRVGSVAFSPDGKFLLTGAGVKTADNDCEARLWDVSTGELACPPFKHWRMTSAIFSPDGRRILTTGRDRRGCVWTLPSDDLPAEDVLLWAEVLSGHKIDASGGLTPLETDVFFAGFHRLRSKFPQAFAFTSDIPVKWHDKKALASAHRDDWFAARFHLDRLLAADPGDSSLKGRRAQAQGELEGLKP